MARRLKNFLGALLLLGGSGLAGAQLADPTRPPPEIGVAAGTPAAPPSGLQSIIQRRNGKPAALIDGAVVELGGGTGEARLIRIGEDFVVLRGPLGDETLRLTPAVEKKAAAAEPKGRRKK